jgi:hypothetical protein
MSLLARYALTRDTGATEDTCGVAEFLLDSLVERRAIVGDASVGCDVAAKKESPQGRGETILQFAGSGMDLSLRKKKGGALTLVVDAIGEQQQVSNYPANIGRSDLPQHSPSNENPPTLSIEHMCMHNYY